MGLRLCLQVRLCDANPFEGEVVARVGVGEDGADLADGRLGQGIDGDGAAHAGIADMVGDDLSVPAAISGPDYRALLFFWT